MKDVNKVKNSYIISFAICALIVLVLDLCSILKGDRIISQLEGRSLQQLDRPYKSTLLDGTWIKGFEKYISDQYAYRDETLKLHFMLLDVLLTKERNGYVKSRYNGKNIVLKIPELKISNTSR